MIIGKPKFPLGFVTMTCDVRAEADLGDNPEFANFVAKSLNRHAQCDWGDCCPEDAKLNDIALKEKTRLFSAYKYQPKTTPEMKIWIITEWDRTVTTILFPYEY